MTSPYIGEIRLFAGSYAPEGWLLCDGSSQQINQYDTLYLLLGTMYGGDGQTTFNLPDLRSRIPLGISSVYAQGTMDGVESVTLNNATMPGHTHTLFGSGSPATTNIPSAGTTLADQVGGADQSVNAYIASGPGVGMSSQSIRPAGSSLPHDNMQPYLTINYIIATQGEFPSAT
jgi:microcystin-dependent protein